MTPVVCWLTRRRLGAYRDGELDSGSRTRLVAHLTGCRACAAELSALDQLRASLRAEAPEPPDAVWDSFWPQVQARLSAPDPAPAVRVLARQGGGFWETLVGHPRLAFGSAVAATAVAVLAILTPWKEAGRQPGAPPAVQIAVPVTPPGSTAPAGPEVATPDPPLVVQAVETTDPDSSVMVFTNEDPGVTVVWVFGLERT